MIPPNVVLLSYIRGYFVYCLFLLDLSIHTARGFLVYKNRHGSLWTNDRANILYIDSAYCKKKPIVCFGIKLICRFFAQKLDAGDRLL